MNKDELEETKEDSRVTQLVRQLRVLLRQEILEGKGGPLLDARKSTIYRDIEDITGEKIVPVMQKYVHPIRNEMNERKEQELASPPPEKLVRCYCEICAGDWETVDHAEKAIQV